MLDLKLLGIALLVVPTAAHAAPNALLLAEAAAYVNNDTPISIHNFLHYKQEADRLYADYRIAFARDGGRLRPEERATFDARYRSLAIRTNRWLAADYPPDRRAAATLGERPVAAFHGTIPPPFANFVPLPTR